MLSNQDTRPFTSSQSSPSTGSLSTGNLLAHNDAAAAVASLAVGHHHNTDSTPRVITLVNGSTVVVGPSGSQINIYDKSMCSFPDCKKPASCSRLKRTTIITTPLISEQDKAILLSCNQKLYVCGSHAWRLKGKGVKDKKKYSNNVGVIASNNNSNTNTNTNNSPSSMGNGVSNNNNRSQQQQNYYNRNQQHHNHHHHHHHSGGLPTSIDIQIEKNFELQVNSNIKMLLSTHPYPQSVQSILDHPRLALLLAEQREQHAQFVRQQHDQYNAFRAYQKSQYDWTVNEVVTSTASVTGGIGDGLIVQNVDGETSPGTTPTTCSDGTTSISLGGLDFYGSLTMQQHASSPSTTTTTTTNSKDSSGVNSVLDSLTTLSSTSVNNEFTPTIKAASPSTSPPTTTAIESTNAAADDDDDNNNNNNTDSKETSYEHGFSVVGASSTVDDKPNSSGLLGDDVGLFRGGMLG